MADINRSRVSHPKRVFSAQDVMSYLANWWAVGISPRFLSGAVAGAAIVLVIGGVLGFYGQPSLFDVRGTLVRPPESSAQVIGSYQISAGQTSADVLTTRDHNQVIVQVKVTSPVLAHLQFGFDSDDLTVVNASQNGQPLADISCSTGLVSLPQTADGVFKVTFGVRTNRSSTIHISVSDNNVTTTQDLATGGFVGQK